MRAYLLGTVDFQAALDLQRSLAREVACEGSAAALILCEHPPLITVGREGSASHVRFSREELEARGWPVRWVSRGGGCLLHAPGQLAVYPVVPLERHRLGLAAFLERLQRVLIAVLDDFGVRASLRRGRSGVWVADRPVAGGGLAVRDWVSNFGLALNVNPDPYPFRHVLTGGDDRPMTTLERERRGRLRPSLVRERVLEHFCAGFGFGAPAVFFGHRSMAAASLHGCAAAGGS